jgi:hypothetical protein
MIASCHQLIMQNDGSSCCLFKLQHVLEARNDLFRNHHHWNCNIYFLWQSDCFYNGGWTEDVREIIKYLHHRYPKTPLFCVGTSIGANIVVCNFLLGLTLILLFYMFNYFILCCRPLFLFPVTWCWKVLVAVLSVLEGNIAQVLPDLWMIVASRSKESIHITNLMFRFDSDFQLWLVL